MLVPLISRLLYHFGFTIQIKKIVATDFNEIKDVLIRFKINNDIKSYSNFLNKQTGTNYQRLRFIGSGGGMGTTQTHTIVKKEDLYLFEKVFNVNSQEFLSLKINYDYIKKELEKRNIEIPELLNIFETKVLGVCQFEYIPKLESLENNGMGYKVELLRKLWEVPSHSSFFNGDYTHLTIILTRLTHLLFHLVSKQTLFHLLSIKEYAENQKIVFTHSDFYMRNVYDNYIIDWDEAGFYPFGLDMATVLHSSNISKNNKLSVQEIFKRLSDFKLTESEQIGTVYYFIILAVFKVNNETVERWIEELYVIAKENLL